MFTYWDRPCRQAVKQLALVDLVELDDILVHRLVDMGSQLAAAVDTVAGADIDHDL